MTARGLRVVPEHGTATTGSGAGDVILAGSRASAQPAIPAEKDRSDWTSRAVCATQDPDMLFVTGAAQRQAARMCDGCPVKLECLADALDNQVEFGVWGGLTERQRRAILRRSPDVSSWLDVLVHARDRTTAATAG